jgi:hypothetical protein
MTLNRIRKFLKGFLDALIVIVVFFTLVGLASLFSPEAGPVAAFVLIIAGLWGFLSTTLP